MVDYTKAVDNGTMMIRDLGQTVEFWFKTGSSTWINGQKWGYQANGKYVESTTNISTGGDWHRFGSVVVNDSQSVLFRIFNSGLGWATTDFNQNINRSSIPGAPSPVDIYSYNGTSIAMGFGAAPSNGSAIDQYQITYGPDPNVGVYTITSTGASTLTGLATGTTYYIWVRAHNAIGWGPWSKRVQVTTWRVPDAPDAVVISSITDDSVYATFTGNGNGGAATDAYQIGYGTSSSSPQTIVSSDGSTTITGLAPGKLHYFWARSHNAVGWSPWSARSSALTKRPPDAPSAVTLSHISQLKMNGVFSRNGDGGSPITGYEIGYGISSSAPQKSIVSDGSTEITGLLPGTTYYVWARAKNAYGWSPYSAVRSARTVAGAFVKVGTVWKEAIPYVKVGGVWKAVSPWVKIAGVWKETG